MAGARPLTRAARSRLCGHVHAHLMHNPAVQQGPRRQPVREAAWSAALPCPTLLCCAMLCSPQQAEGGDVEDGGHGANAHLRR